VWADGEVLAASLIFHENGPVAGRPSASETLALCAKPSLSFRSCKVRKLPLTRAGLCFGFIALVVCLWPLGAQGPKKAGNPSAAQWIWLPGKAEPNQTAYFRKEIVLKQRITSAKLYGTCDNRMTVYVNGKEVLSSDAWETPVFREVTEHLRSPRKGTGETRNVIAVKAYNSEGPAGLVLRLELDSPKKEALVITTDATWRASEQPTTGWHEVNFDDSAWSPARVVGKLGGGPWTQVTAASLTGGARFKKPTATPIELIKVKKDFKVELLYSVPKETQGSWVSLCTDPKGRLIASDQYGKLYRITPPPAGGSAEATRVEELPVDLGEAQGLLWAFDSLYVVVNRGKKYESGLYRVRSSRGDDTLDTKEKLRSLQGPPPKSGSGEHGTHAVLLSPDKKSLYVLCGNHTSVTELSGSAVPQVWGEDFLLPRLWDASGHAVGILAPGGHIYRVDPDGKNWELISIGYRNQYDAAFNRDGELFTYDSDMEWFMNLPFYRPTRVMHAVPGSDFGWRSGSATMPVYFPDNLPPACDIGPGSPTGVAFGYGAKFPAKYQDAFFICDWSYGKLYAVHLKAEGATYVSEAEEFLNGSPLPLTDLVVNPKDGALYFAIGGRTTMSGLYRVTYTGSESTEPSKGSDGARKRGERKSLEAYYGKKDPQAIEVAWPYLSDPDRFLRYAARSVLEFQDPKAWQKKALAETDPVALTHAVIGLTRVGDKALQPRVLAALDRVNWEKLTTPQKLDYLRAYQLTFIRMGMPDAATKDAVGRRLDGFYPAGGRELNAELAKLVSYLEVPGAVAKTLALMAKAPTQEEQIDYALSLRVVRSGWTLAQREEYLNWFHRAAGYRGGHSFHGFMRNIRNDALKTLSAQEEADLKAVVAAMPQPASPKFETKPRPFVKKWTADELTPILEKGLNGRDFDRGRNLFGEAKCFACHRFNNEGGGTGPDLTALSGRFGARDLVESLLEPSKVISDQYQAIVVTTTDDRVYTGRIVNLSGDGVTINTEMLDPNKLVNVNRKLIDSIAPSKVSMMPDGLLDTFTQDEVLDLVAYLYSRGDRNHKMFRK
jgi:putative heme-binding domain-containing protein